MATKTAKTSEKEGNMRAEVAATSSKVSMAALTELLEAHRTALSAEFKAAISTLEVKLECVQATVSSHGQRLTTLESHAESIHERVERVETSLAAVTESNAKLKAKAADLEAQSRRNNIRIIGVLESLEGPWPTTFFSQLLYETFGDQILPSPPELDSAHRSLIAKPKPGEGQEQ